MSTLLERLRKIKDDRGMMADLRCILVPRKKHRAWPALSRLGVPITDEVSTFVAGLYAVHSEETTTGNLGDTCRAVERERDEKRGDDNRLTPTERRFQHLLASDTGDELHDRVLRMVLMAKSQGVPVNYIGLATALRYWNDRTRTEWAAAFWE